MSNHPLRYRISKWEQAVNCLSNNSKHLHIHVSDIQYEQRLTGTLISVEHDKLGILFASLVDSKGTMLTKQDMHSYHELSTSQILEELKKFGFNISFDDRANLPATQLAYLMNLRDLKFDKLRKLKVRWKDAPSSEIIVAFLAYQEPNWLNNSYACDEDEFDAAMMKGSAVNISGISMTDNFSWSWLDYVADIDDILNDNMGGR